VRWEVRPALRTAEFFERLYEALDSQGTISIAAVLEEFQDEVRLTTAGR
jgi:spermidine synthase